MGCGGGGDTVIQQAPTTPAPSATESAADIYKARLEYDPKMAALEMQQQQQYMPQQAALYQSLYNQYYPEVSRKQQAMQKELYPQQSGILEAGAGNVIQGLQSLYQQQISNGLNQQTLAQLQQPQSAIAQAMGQQAMAGLQPSPIAGIAEQEALYGLIPSELQQRMGQQAIAGAAPSALQRTIEQQSLAGIVPSELQQRMGQEAIAGLTPTGLTPDQQSAIDAIRMRQAQGLSKQLRERSNLGGTMYGGRSQQLESTGLQELGQRFAAEDVDRLMAQRQSAMQQALGVQSAAEAQRQAGLQGIFGAGQFGLSQQQQALSGLTGATGLQEQMRQQALQNLMGAAQLSPNLRQQALSGAGGVAGLQTQQQQQALQNAMALQQQRQQAAIPYMQILYPQVGTAQPNIQPYQYQSAVPSADTLYNALFQASQPNYFAQQSSPSPLWGLAGQIGGATAGSMFGSGGMFGQRI